ncbi:putative intracellular protease/amidase [Panacagrimonas perspica]|uniref:Putative intracellular protease/amidase n=1 Tax=Panacagrimonas perspica TaxID=381431 RepID=A0A4R7NWX7_9GAMM|nr:type 1 glutamine amidotransferase domain-containing protein [Panacagrimonas perspica]TDU25598.1 putative intracellular protease/amidase [Panacagrimonas perspica]THD03877.1 type 1 glutamine amidotransferase domain-containing protein [Panacagrimonas perspica]
MKKVLMVVTSHDRLGDTGRPTGFWLEEFASPYYVFRDARFEVVVASPKGGRPPLDPKSAEAGFQTDATRRFEADTEAGQVLASSQLLSAQDPAGFDAVFYPGGHGPLWDLVSNPDSLRLIRTMHAAGKIVAAVCHGPAALLNVSIDGIPIVRGRKVTGFTNTEEEAVGLTQVVPLLVEDEMRRLGGLYAKGDDWAPFVVVDGNLVTGQNPASSGPAARAVVEKLS